MGLSDKSELPALDRIYSRNALSSYFLEFSRYNNKKNHLYQAHPVSKEMYGLQKLFFHGPCCVAT